MLSQLQRYSARCIARTTLKTRRATSTPSAFISRQFTSERPVEMEVDVQGCYSIVSAGTGVGFSSSDTGTDHFRVALMRHVDPSLAAEALRLDPHGAGAAVDLSVAIQHHEALLQTLSSKCGLKIVHLPSDGYPDSVFIEDTLVVVGDQALITRPGAKSRQGEVDGVREELEYSKKLSATDAVIPALKVAELERGTLDGGDVLFTGKEFFVGKSHRTSLDGIKSLAKVFPSYRVTAVDITHNLFTCTSAVTDRNNGLDMSVPLHLKSMCSRGGDDILVVGGRAGHIFSKVVEAVAPQTYKFLQLPDMTAANCIWVNGVLVRPLSSEMSETSSDLLDTLGGNHVQVATSELAKLDGAITCCSVLV